MDSLKVIHDYKNIDVYRLSFNRLSNLIFGIDFIQWYENGFWNDNYICYSYIDGQEVVANISVYKMDLIVNGKRRKALQICAVMTNPGYQKMGLSKNLMNTILEKYEKEFDVIFLLGNKSVLNFYPKFGFEPLLESKYEVQINVKKSEYDYMMKLDTSDADNLKLVRKLASSRKLISNVMGVENAQNILIWQCFNGFKDSCYYIKDEDIIVVCKQDNQILHIFDIISKNDVYFYSLINKIANEEVEKIIFYFTPDLLHVETACSLLQPDDELFHDMFFVKADALSISQNFKFPKTAQA
jgi:predicted N-acetyltransferase YhbS